MAFLQLVRKILFFILVVGSLIIGLSFVAYGADWKEAPVFSFVFYLVIGLVPFLLGYLIRMGKKVKEFFLESGPNLHRPDYWVSLSRV